MILRLILAFVVFWVLFRLFRLVAKYLLARTEPAQKVHERRRRGRNHLESRDAIDVEFREGAATDEGSDAKRE